MNIALAYGALCAISTISLVLFAVVQLRESEYSGASFVVSFDGVLPAQPVSAPSVAVVGSRADVAVAQAMCERCGVPADYDVRCFDLDACELREIENAIVSAPLLSYGFVNDTMRVYVRPVAKIARRIMLAPRTEPVLRAFSDAQFQFGHAPDAALLKTLRGKT